MVKRSSKKHLKLKTRRRRHRHQTSVKLLKKPLKTTPSAAEASEPTERSEHVDELTPTRPQTRFHQGNKHLRGLGAPPGRRSVPLRADARCSSGPTLGASPRADARCSSDASELCTASSGSVRWFRVVQRFSVVEQDSCLGVKMMIRSQRVSVICLFV